MVGKPMNVRQERRRAETRAEILEAAWDAARQDGLSGLTLAGVARRVGMRAPSLYSYFDSKNAVFDAMFAQGCHQFLAGASSTAAADDPLEGLKSQIRYFIDFCTEDQIRYQLLFQRTIPGFTPSAESYALAVRALDILRQRLASSGIDTDRSLDLLTALTTGIVDQQISNDPGGDRWTRLADEAVEMFFFHTRKRVQGPEAGTDGHRTGPGQGSEPHRTA
ncbi:TetR/AcrR family transcriptional regulator [Nocardiopsis valliformis]|uniref:TetR/AcrR family transcriptional regulator n=1 Tax=Nocardiopsis valliformis TaxID=239974 RepID=UPI0019552F06|nr:TetR/AcrR family transcriptional regulator [Nocardiopsis valliformis]